MKEDPNTPGAPELAPLPLSPNKVIVTSFSRKMLAGIIGILFAVTAVSLIFAFSPKKKATEMEKAQERAAKAQPAAMNEPTAPECVSTGPKSYAEVRKVELLPAGVPSLGPPLAPGRQAETVDGGPGSGSLTYLAHPAPAPATTLTPEQQAILAREELRRKEALEARRSELTFGKEAGAPQKGSAAPQHAINTGSTLDQLQGMVNKVAANGYGIPGSVPSPTADPDQNLQDEKREFAGEKRAELPYLAAPLLKPVSPYELKAGTILPATLITGINSDLPGQIVAQLREHVFDTVTGKYLLLPQGTRLIGEYDSKIAYGQSRILAVWTRLILPSGNSINLEGMPGVDLSGYAGATGRVNNHYGKLVTGVILGSVIGAGAQIATGGQGAPNVPPSFGQLAAGGAAQNINQAGQQITQKNLNLQPTIEVPPGLKINVFVTKDMILQPVQ